MKVVTHNEVPGIQSMNQDPANEIGRRYVTHRRRKPRTVEQVDAARFQAVELFAESHQTRGWTGAPEEFFRRWFEAHDDSCQALVLGEVNDAFEQLLVTEMDSVVSADRHHAAGIEIRIRKVF